MDATSLQIELARQIVNLAESEAWNAGERIPELRLARRLNVSRSPIRGALLFLKDRGVIEPCDSGGFALARTIDGGSGAMAIIPPSEAEELFGRVMADRAKGVLAQEVSEAELSERYRVSRGLMRKILLRFAHDGLIRRLRGHGWRFVDTLDDEQAVDESYEFRIAVECAGLRARKFRADPGRLAVLRRSHASIMERRPETIAREEWFDINAAFHETLAEWSGNRFILQSVRQQNSLRRMQEYAEFSHLESSRIAQSCREHLAVLDAIEQNDLVFAEALLRRHLSRAANTPD
jgi:DNA-binding GntR family transcriptional regulator